jgi:hypothetical protein
MLRRLLHRPYRYGGINPHVYPLVDETARELRYLALRWVVLGALMLAVGYTWHRLAEQGHQVEVEQAYRQGLQEGLQGAQSCRGAPV